MRLTDLWCWISFLTGCLITAAVALILLFTVAVIQEYRRTADSRRHE